MLWVQLPSGPQGKQSKMNQEYIKVIGTIAADCVKHSIAFKLHNKQLINSTEKITGSIGFFDDSGRSLEIATKNKKNVWFRVLIHEWMHMQQWKEGMFTPQANKENRSTLELAW